MQDRSAESSGRDRIENAARLASIMLIPFIVTLYVLQLTLAKSRLSARAELAKAEFNELVSENSSTREPFRRPLKDGNAWTDYRAIEWVFGNFLVDWKNPPDKPDKSLPFVYRHPELKGPDFSPIAESYYFVEKSGKNTLQFEPTKKSERSYRSYLPLIRYLQSSLRRRDCVPIQDNVWGQSVKHATGLPRGFIAAISCSSLWVYKAALSKDPKTYIECGLNMLHLARDLRTNALPEAIYGSMNLERSANKLILIGLSMDISRKSAKQVIDSYKKLGYIDPFDLFRAECIITEWRGLSSRSLVNFPADPIFLDHLIGNTFQRYQEEYLALADIPLSQRRVRWQARYLKLRAEEPFASAFQMSPVQRSLRLEQTNTMRDLIRLAAASKLYWLENGSAPKRFSMIRKVLGEAIPLDRFRLDKSSLCFQRLKRGAEMLFYSYGPDGKNDHGQSETQRSNSDSPKYDGFDLVVRISLGQVKPK